MRGRTRFRYAVFCRAQPVWLVQREKTVERCKPSSGRASQLSPVISPQPLVERLRTARARGPFVFLAPGRVDGQSLGQPPQRTVRPNGACFRAFVPGLPSSERPSLLASLSIIHPTRRKKKTQRDAMRLWRRIPGRHAPAPDVILLPPVQAVELPA